MDKRLPITAFVASCNEGHLLDRCLKGLSFCDEIYVINLACTDNTKEIASKYNVKILDYPRYPIVEEAHFHAIPLANNDWVLLTDPDEVADDQLIVKIFELFDNKNENLNDYAAIRVPIHFYFKSKALKGTIWGGNKTCRFLYNKNHISLSNRVHEGVIIKENKNIYHINRDNFNIVLHHYWMTSYAGFLEKIHRYISKEGERMYESGLRYSLPKQLHNTINSFKICYINTRGFKDGLVGLFLSLIWGYYTFRSWISLYKYSKKVAS